MKKMDLLGISLTDYTLREAMKRSNEFMYNGALNTISYISIQMLVDAVEDEERKTWIESMDMTVCGETDILRAAGILARNRIREVEEDEFLKEFIRKLSRNKRKLYLIAENEEEVKKLEDYLRCYGTDLLITGRYAADRETVSVDNLINDINDIVPNIIISKLSSPWQEQLMSENRQFVNADIWLGLLEHSNLHNKKSSPFAKISQYLYRNLFRRKINQYKI